MDTKRTQSKLLGLIYLIIFNFREITFCDKIFFIFNKKEKFSNLNLRFKTNI